MERTCGEVCLQTLPGSCMTHMLTTMTWCIVNMTIRNKVIVNTQVFAFFKLIKATNHDINDATCLHVGNMLQHPRSHQTTRSIQDTMVNAPKENHSPLPAGKYSKYTKQFTRRCQQANEGQSGLEASRVRALGALRSIWSEKKLSVKKRWEMCFLSNEEKKKLIQDCVDRETAVARKRVRDAETPIMQKLETIWNAEQAWSTPRKPDEALVEMLYAILQVPTKGGWGRQGIGRQTYRAWQAEWRWRTWLGDGHNVQNGTVPHAAFSDAA